MNRKIWDENIEGRKDAKLKLIAEGNEERRSRSGCPDEEKSAVLKNETPKAKARENVQ